MRLAYLTNRYPAISHAFVLREVRALRRRGVEVEAFSIHRSDPGHLLSNADWEEFRTTHAVLPPGWGRLSAAHLRALAGKPARYLSALRFALGLGRGARGRLWQAFYFVEAIAVWRECRRRGAHHVHAQFTSPAADVAMLVAAYDDGCSYSFAAHGTDIYATDRERLAEKARRAKFVVCVSDFGRSQLMMLVESEHWSKIHVIPCGVDLERYPVASRDERDRALRVLTVGRLAAEKGQAVLLDAIAELWRRGVSVELTVVGDGPLRTSLEHRAADLAVAGRVRFVGKVGQDKIPEHYAAADVFCLPSFGEGLPVVLMEAMATGLPVVASRIMGIPELVEHDRDGLLVAPGRADHLADALERVAGSPELRRGLGGAARAKAERFDIERSAAGLEAVFARALGRR